MRSDVMSGLGGGSEGDGRSVRSCRTSGKQPMTALPQKTRGLRAANAVLTNGYSPAQAMSEFMVEYHTLHYYLKKLRDAGMPSASTESSSKSAERSASPALSIASSTRSTAWDDYCQAYMLAGELVPKVGRVKAAQQASQKCGVLISASTARRAAQRPGEPPKKPGPDTYIPSYIEHKLESLCLALRELNLPIFRFMVLNYVNVLIRDTAFAERFKDREVRRD